MPDEQAKTAAEAGKAAAEQERTQAEEALRSEKTTYQTNLAAELEIAQLRPSTYRNTCSRRS